MTLNSIRTAYTKATEAPNMNWFFALDGVVPGSVIM